MCVCRGVGVGAMYSDHAETGLFSATWVADFSLSTR